MMEIGITRKLLERERIIETYRNEEMMKIKQKYIDIFLTR